MKFSTSCYSEKELNLYKELFGKRIKSIYKMKNYQIKRSESGQDVVPYILIWDGNDGDNIKLSEEWHSNSDHIDNGRLPSVLIGCHFYDEDQKNLDENDYVIS